MKLLKFLLILVLVISLETSKVYNNAFSKSKYHKLSVNSRNKTKGDCLKASFKGFINFVFGVFHGFGGFEKKHNLKKQCPAFKTEVANLAIKLGIIDGKDPKSKKEADEEKFDFVPDALDSSFLNLYFKTGRSTEEQENLNKEITLVEKNYDKYTCYKNDLKDTYIGSRVLQFGRRMIDSISFLIPKDIKSSANRTITSVAKIATSVTKVAGKVTKPIYKEVCSLRKIVFLLMSMILSPGKITTKNISDLIDEIMKQLKLIGKVLSAGKKATNFLKKSWDWFVDKMADNENFLISIAGEIAQDIRDDIEEKIENLKEKSLELVKKASENFAKFKKSAKIKVADFTNHLITSVKDFISSISNKLWAKITKLGIFDSIKKSIDSLVKPVTDTVEVIKPKLKEAAKAMAEIVKFFIKVFKCAFSAVSALVTVAKNVLSIVLNIFVIISAFSLAGGSSGVVIPVVVAMFVDMGMAIICNGDEFEKMFQAIKYSYITKTAYSAGAALGLAINTIGNSDFIVIPLVDAFAGIVKDGIPDIGEHLLNSIISIGDGVKDSISTASDSLDIFTRILPDEKEKKRLK